MNLPKAPIPKPLPIHTATHVEILRRRSEGNFVHEDPSRQTHLYKELVCSFLMIVEHRLVRDD